MQLNSLMASGLNNKVFKVPCINQLIQKSDGFKKKDLATYKIDLQLLCGFGCRYCSSNAGLNIKFKKKTIEQLGLEQLGKSYTPKGNPELSIEYLNLISTLDKELSNKPKSYGSGEVLMFSELTDAFSPRLVNLGYTRKALELIFKKTSFRVRILTKNACVGDEYWIEFFEQYRENVIIGMSTGTTDEVWTKQVELGTSSPSDRFQALKNLQDAGIPTYGMLCPIFPTVVEKQKVDELVERINPDMVETIYAEPYNDRENWEIVRNGFTNDPDQFNWFTEAYEKDIQEVISAYHGDLYQQLLDHSNKNDWTHKLRYLLYENEICSGDADKFRGLVGILLQNKPNDSGYSKNKVLAKLQAEIGL